jgi:hypothetical protein
MSVESLLFQPVVALQFSSMEREISWARLLSPNQIREIVMDSDSDKEKYSTSEDTEDDEPRPPLQWSSIAQPQSPDFSASSSIRLYRIHEGRLISNARSEISRKREHVFKQTKVGSKVQNFSYKLTCLFFDIVALSFNTFFPT